VLLRIRRGFHAPTQYLELSETHAVGEIIPSLCQQLGMFGTDNVGLYRCPPLPSTVNKKNGSGLTPESKLDDSLSLEDQGVNAGACLLVMGGDIVFNTAESEVQALPPPEPAAPPPSKGPPAQGPPGKGAPGKGPPGKGAPTTFEEEIVEAVEEVEAEFEEQEQETEDNRANDSAGNADGSNREDIEDRLKKRASEQNSTKSAAGSPIRMSAHRHSSVGKGSPVPASPRSMANTPTKGPGNLETIAAESPDWGTIQRTLITRPQRTDSSFKSKTERFPTPKSPYRESYLYKDSWKKHSNHNQQDPKTKKRDTVKPGQDWMFNSHERREDKQGRLYANEWEPTMRASYDKSSKPIRHLPL